MHNMRTVLTIVIITLLTSAVTNAGTLEELAATVERLKQQVAAQEKRIAELEIELDKTKSATKADETKIDAEEDENVLEESQRQAIREFIDEQDPGVRDPNDFRMYWKNGIRMQTKDGRLKLKFGGRLMADFGWIDGGGIESDLSVDLEDAAEVRRARLYTSGTIYDNLGFKLQFDFAGGEAKLKDAYLKLKELPFGNLTVGHFKEPFSLEELTSSKYSTFMERTLPNVFAPGRNMGVMANSTLLDERMTWALGLFRPSSDDFGEDDTDGEGAVTVRLTALPWYENEGR